MCLRATSDVGLGIGVVQMLLVLEFMQGGNLAAAIAADNERGGVRRLAWKRHGLGIAIGIALGLHYLHSKRVCSKPPSLTSPQHSPQAKSAGVLGQLFWVAVLRSSTAQRDATACGVSTQNLLSKWLHYINMDRRSFLSKKT